MGCVRESECCSQYSLDSDKLHKNKQILNVDENLATSRRFNQRYHQNYNIHRYVFTIVF